MFSNCSQLILCFFFILIADDYLSLSHSCSKLQDTTSIQVQPTGTAYSIQPKGTANCTTFSIISTKIDFIY
jgi:hypothetical protein